jgi:hypothetical protein
VLVELATPRQGADLRGALEELLGAAMERGIVADAVIAESGAQRAAIWKLREEHSEAQKRAGASVKNDISVPVSRVPELIRRAAAACERLVPGIRCVPFGHLGDGNIHFNLVQPEGADGAAFLARDHELMDAVNDIVRDLDGSFSAEHGIGRLKPYMMPEWRGGAELDLMRRIKARSIPPAAQPGEDAAVTTMFATQWDRWVGDNSTRDRYTDDAYIRGDVTPLSAQVEGYVRQGRGRRLPARQGGRPAGRDRRFATTGAGGAGRGRPLGAQAAIENIKARKAAQHAVRWPRPKRDHATQADVERTKLEAERQRALLASTFGTQQKVEQADADQSAWPRRWPASRPSSTISGARGGARHPGIGAARRGKGQAGGARPGEDQSRLHQDRRAGRGDGQRARRVRRPIRRMPARR